MASVDLSLITDGHYPNNGEDGLEVPASAVLYGRTCETNLLLNAYQQVLRTIKKTNSVLIHGVSGSGKTALADQLRQPVYESEGYFVAGKYFQGSAIQEPYSAIMAAFSDLCDLVSQSENFTEERRREIQKKLGTDGRLLAKAISNLSPFLDATEGEEIDIRNEAAFAKFKVACKVFLHAMSSDKHPIVLFIDDIQWMDGGSRQLIALLLNDAELKNVMLVLAYRDEDANCEIDILMEESDVAMLDIPLQNISAGDVHEFVCEMIGSSSADKELSHLVELKTGGNPFHMIQFVEFIQREGLMIYDAASSSWQYDVDEIQKEIMVPESLADLLALKIWRLPFEVQETLKVASLIGFQFREDVLLGVPSAIRDQAIEEEKVESLQSVAVSLDLASLSLKEALNGGFIEKTNDGYQFSHDKLHSAFQSMTDGAEEEELHLAIGETFLYIGGAESMYQAAVHLHHAPAFGRQKAERVKLAAVNLEAANYCIRKSAFVDAATLLRRGLELLDPDEKWTLHYDLAFQMTETLAKMALIIGNHECCKDMTKEALLRAKTTEMKIDSLLIDVECRMTNNEVDGSIAAANRALRVLGVKLPRKVAYRHVVMKLLKVKWTIGRKSDEDILSLPPMGDRTMSTIVRLLFFLSCYCFLKDERYQAVYSALLATELTLKDGLSPFSASAFTIYGVAELYLGDSRRAYRFGKLALTLLDRIKNKDADCPTTGFSLAFLTHRYDSVSPMPDILRRAIRRGFDVGDIVFGTYCLSMCYGMEIMLGTNLEQLEDFMRSSYRQIRDLSQDAMVMWAQPAIQYVLNLRSQEAVCWKDLTNLTGEVMDEGAYMRQVRGTNHRNPALVTMVAIYKARLACVFGFWSLSESIYKDIKVDIKGIGTQAYLTYGSISLYWSAAIASYSLYKENGKRKHLRIARKNRRNLQRAEAEGCPNASSFLTLIDAEELSLRKSVASYLVAGAYNRAFDAAAAAGLSHLKGCICERTAFYYVNLGLFDEADTNFTKAMEIYKYEMSAHAMHSWLKEASEEALSKLVDHKTGLEGLTKHETVVVSFKTDDNNMHG
jgi:predicted ATPase